MSDEILEPGPDPRKIRNQLSRKPDVPPRVDQVLQSLEADAPLSIRKPSENAATTVKTQITAAVYYLNRWEDYDVRVRPYVTEHYRFNGREYTFEEGTKKLARGWYLADQYLSEADFDALRPADAEHYWRCTFHVRAPLKRGFRQMDPDRLNAAHASSAASRGVTIKHGSGAKHRRQVLEVTPEPAGEVPSPRTVASASDIEQIAARLSRRRTVADPADLRRVAAPARPLITQRPPGIR